jgi:hypothetical protein
MRTVGATRSIQGATQMSDLDKFLSPESMLTPGLAGGMTMGITNALAFQFALPTPQPALIALALSFVFGLCVFSAKSNTGRTAVKALFWVVNSLVIFTVAAGSNAIGMSAQTARAPGIGDAAALVERLLPTAHAQTRPELPWCCIDGVVLHTDAAACQRRNGQVASSKEGAQQVCEAARAAAAKERERRAFFQPWLRPANKS